MESQLSLDTPPAGNELGPFQRHSETSRKAAIDNYPRSGSQRARILDALIDRPQTREELEHTTGLSGNAVRPRVVELIDGEWVRELRDHTGLVERQTASGSAAVVLCATPKAHLLRPA